MGKEDDLLRAAVEGDVAKTEKLLTKPHGSFFKRSTARVKTDDEDKPAGPASPKLERVKVTHINVNCTDADGKTPLILAALNGHTPVIELLIRHEADVAATDSTGNTALNLAAWHGKTDALDLLMKQGAQAHAPCSTGDTALHYACQYGKTFCILKLLQNGAEVKHANNNGDTALDVAARYKRKEAVGLIIDADPSLTIKGKVLLESARNGHKEIVQQLLDAGVDVNATDAETWDSALHLAVRFFRKNIVELLLLFGADPELSNKAGETPYTIVEAYNAEKPNDLYPIIVGYLNTDEKDRVLKQAAERNHSDLSVIGNAANKYPLLRAKKIWTKNTDEFRKSADLKHYATNVFEKDPEEYWQMPSARDNWIVFDLLNEYRLTGIAFQGFDNQQMPKNWLLESGPSEKGPWKTVSVGMCTADVNDHVVDDGDIEQVDVLGKLQEKHGFDGTSRFWRVTLKDNWGAFSTVVHRIALFGVDLKLQAWLHQLGFDKYFPAFLDAGFAQMSDLFELTKPQMESIIELPGHRRKITLALRDIMETLIAGELRDLWWGVAPPARCQENTPVPAFSVRGAKNCTDPVELIVHGCPSVTGTLVRSLAPSQAAPNGPSEAVFDDIVLAPAGDYLIEVHSIERPDILVRQEAPISVDFALKDEKALAAAFDDIDDLLNF